MDTISKQSWEEFTIAGDFTDQADTGELASLVGSSVVAEDKDGNDVSATLLDQGTIAVDGTQLRILLRAGTEDLSPYKVTFKIQTSLNNKWEIDVKVRIKEL